MDKNKPRRPWLAVLLSLLVTGLGHVYSGEGRRGILLYFVQALLFALLIVFFVLYTNAYTTFLVLAVGISFIIYCAIDAYRSARANRFTYNLKKYNRWYVYGGLFVLSGFILQPIAGELVKEHTVRAYKIASGAMLPTLYAGDHILVNRFFYKRSTPMRGDVVVFEYPKDPKVDYIKRIAAVGGDTVEINEKKLFVNGTEVEEPFAAHYSKTVMAEESSPRDYFGPVTVPAGTVFVLGDNRDNSFDSRFWGFVDEEKIRGKVVSLYWSWDYNDKSVRWDRIGSSVQ